MKKCKRCGSVKRLAEFYAQADGRQGRRPECITCTTAAQAAYRKRERTAIRDRQRESRKATATRDRAIANARYADAPEYRERVKANARATYHRAKHKRLARNAVTAAIREGVLIPEGCLFCDDPKVHGHHHDYSKPLDVTWLCPRHHGLAHRIVSEPGCAGARSSG